MKLSIVTPVYNDPRVGRALDAVASQRHEAELDLVVVDGGSTDKTLDVLAERRDQIASLVSEPDDGIYDAMNKGIERATGDIVGILNADDQYYDSYVFSDVLGAFQDPDIDACYGDLVYVDANNRIVRYWKSGKYRALKFYLGWMPPHPTFFVRRCAYKQYGAFDTQYRIAGDYELMLRFLLKYRLRVKYLDRVLVQMSIGGSSNRSAGNIVRANLEVVKAWRNNDLPFGYMVPIMKLAQKPFQYVRRPARRAERSAGREFPDRRRSTS